MQDSNYYQVSGWMINRLNLKGTELQIYAIIYGFSQDGESEFTGNIRYLCEWTSSTKKTIITALKSLVEKNIIIKNTVDMNGVIFNRYKANLSIVNGEKEVNPQCKNYTTPSVKITPPQCKNYTDPSVKITPNNNIYNTNDNKTDNTLFGKAESVSEEQSKKPTDRELTEEFNRIWEKYPRKEGRKNALRSYISARKKGTSEEQVIRGLEAYIEHIRANNTAVRYIKHGSSWFAQECWQDDYRTGQTVPNDTADWFCHG